MPVTVTSAPATNNAAVSASHATLKHVNNSVESALSPIVNVILPYCELYAVVTAFKIPLITNESEVVAPSSKPSIMCKASRTEYGFASVPSPSNLNSAGIIVTEPPAANSGVITSFLTYLWSLPLTLTSVPATNNAAVSASHATLKHVNNSVESSLSPIVNVILPYCELYAVVTAFKIPLITNESDVVAPSSKPSIIWRASATEYGFASVPSPSNKY